MEIKYIVIKKDDALKYLPEPMLISLECILNTIAEGRAKDNKKPANQYYICNTDEPYAEIVHGVIAAGEYEKGKGGENYGGNTNKYYD